MAQYKYQTSKGIKWLTKFTYVDPISGQTKSEYKRGFDSKRAAKSYEDEFVDNLMEESGVNDPIKPKTFEDVFYEYLESHKREEIKASTLRTKNSIFEHHIFPTFKDMLITAITDDDIAAWQRKKKTEVMEDGKHYSNAYLRTMQCQLNSILNYAFSKGYLKLNPLADIKNMGVKDKRIEFWSPEEYERFAYCAMNHPEYYYAFEVLYWCGLREGEMLALTLRDIDLKQKTISITKTYNRVHKQDVISTPKTPSSVRIVSMPEFLCDELEEYIAMLYDPQPDDRIFMVSKTGLIKMFHSLSDEAGLRRITVHGLRHSHVSLLISKKYDIFEVSKRIGHHSIKTTQDTYGHLFDDVQKAIASDLDLFRRG